MRFQDITVIVPRAMGATLLSTVVLRQLRQAHPGRTIRCIAKYPELLAGLPYIDELIEWDTPDVFIRAIKDKEIIDLSGTLDHQPNRRPSPVHLIDLLCQRAGVNNDLRGPECFLSSEEVNDAKTFVDSVRHDSSKAVIAITTRTSTRNKEWRSERWQELVQQLSSHVRWFHLGEGQPPDLSGVEYLTLTPRQAIAVTRYVDGVVTVDTFLLHAAATQRLSTAGVITLLGSSRPECVSYPTFHNIFFNFYECQPCGRPYNSFDLHILQDGSIDRWPNGKPKKWECEHVGCMDLIDVGTVADAIRPLILK